MSNSPQKKEVGPSTLDRTLVELIPDYKSIRVSNFYGMFNLEHIYHEPEDVFGSHINQNMGIKTALSKVKLEQYLVDHLGLTDFYQEAIKSKIEVSYDLTPSNTNVGGEDGIFELTDIVASGTESEASLMQRANEAEDIELLVTEEHLIDEDCSPAKNNLRYNCTSINYDAQGKLHSNNITINEIPSDGLVSRIGNVTLIYPNSKIAQNFGHISINAQKIVGTVDESKMLELFVSKGYVPDARNSRIIMFNNHELCK